MSTVNKYIGDVVGETVIISEKFTLKPGGPPIRMDIPGKLRNDENGIHIIYTGDRIELEDGGSLHYFSSGSEESGDLRVPGDKINLIG